MPHFSGRSQAHLMQCHHKLQQVFNEVIKHFDCTVTCGHRGETEQNLLYFSTPQRTKVRWPNSRHNKVPSIAVDVTPYPVDYNDRERQTLFAGFVLGIAAGMGIDLVWGGDWDDDTEVDDNKFDDFPHFQLEEYTL